MEEGSEVRANNNNHNLERAGKCLQEVRRVISNRHSIMVRWVSEELLTVTYREISELLRES